MDSSAGEAATLFGEPDPATDPFAVAVAQDSQDASSGEIHQESSVASELFNGDSDSVNFFSATGVLNSNAYDQYGGGTEVAQGYQPGGGATVTGSTHSQQYRGQSSQASGYYSSYQPASIYTQQQPHSYGAPAYDTSYTQPASTYGSYAPHGAMPAYTVPAAAASTAPASYDPYRPAAQSAPVQYTSQAASATTSQTPYNAYNSSQLAYDPYKPAQPPGNPYAPQTSGSPASYGTTVESSYAYSLTAAGAQTTHSFAAPPPAPAPAPSAAAAATYRPKTSNAYDPPLPSPKPSKRVSSHMLYPGSPPAQQVPLTPPPPPQAPPRRQASVPNDGYPPSVPSVPSLHHQPPVQRYTSPQQQYTSPQQSATYGGLPQPTLNGYDAASHYGISEGTHLSQNGPAHALPQEHHSWDVPQTTDPRHSHTPVVSSPLPAAAPPRVPFSSALPSEESLAAAEHGADPYAPDAFNGAATSPPAYPRIQESSSYEPYRVASPPRRFVSPPIGGALTNGLTTPPTEHGSPYAPSHSTTEHSKPPGSASVRPVQNAHMRSFEQSHRGSVPKSPPTAPRKLTLDSRHKAPANVYDPPLPDQKHAAPPSTRASPPMRVSPNAYDSPALTDARRAASPPAMPSRPPSVVTGGYDPYAPLNNRMRSMSNGSALSSISAVLEDPYSPLRHVRQQTSDSARSSLDRGPGSVHTSHANITHDAPAQVLSVPHQTQAMYAPSPSLVGANDPLGRTSVRIPVISFGFGGKLVTCFHGTLSSGGFDVALASRYSSEITMQALNKVIPESALDSSAASYPGPLFSDPGTPTTTSLVRTAAAQTKTKKARVIKYLEERAEELNRGLGYFHSDTLEGRRAEGKHILVKLLQVMVENDGRLSGRPQIDAAVRSALSPRAAQPAPDALQLATSISGDIQLSGLATTSPYLSLTGMKDLTDTVVATHTLNSSHLDKIQEFLLKGEKRAASHYASDQKLWAHAMVIASSVDKQAWKDVVTEFVRTELASPAPGKATDGREALRVAYSLFAGHGPASIQELASPKPLAPTSSSLQVTLPSTSSVTPVSASFSGSTEPMNVSPDILAKWADTVAMIYSSPLTYETSSALTSLGDQLAASLWYEAAHACYLLSPQTSPIGGVGSSSRMVLLGSPSPSVALNFVKDPDPLIFTEIAEFALSLTTPAKGQDAYTGLPHLQPYRLLRAANLAEMGHIQLANRYCEAISNSLNKNSPYINPTFFQQLKGLNDRLVAAPQLDKSASWIASKVAKPSLDGIGSWVGGRLTKFIAGEDSPGHDQHTHGQHQQPFSGPFSQYSTISSTTSSAAPSPHQSTVNLAQTATNSPPPFRTGSAMGLRVSAAPQINRASSAMDYTRPSLSRRSSPVPRVASANPATSTFADASLYSQALNGHAFGSSSKQSLNGHGTHDDHHSVDSDSPQSNGPALGNWWGASDASAVTPTASSFGQGDESPAQTATSGQFISLMDDYSATPTAYQSQRSFSSNPTIDEEDDDLGLGNSSSRSNRQEMSDERKGAPAPEPAKEAPKEEPRPKIEDKHSTSSGWLSRLWKRESSTPAPIKANLGESTSFYYDKELKRWVNKNSNSEAAPSAPTPPPPRAQTASPGASMRALPVGATPPPPPPARPATTDPGDGLPKPPMRIRSNLVPPESDSSAPPMPMSAGLPGQGPPQSRSRAATKRTARSRYVDVFAQQ